MLSDEEERGEKDSHDESLFFLSPPFTFFSNSSLLHFWPSSKKGKGKKIHLCQKSRVCPLPPPSVPPLPLPPPLPPPHLCSILADSSFPHPSRRRRVRRPRRRRFPLCESAGRGKKGGGEDEVKRGRWLFWKKEMIRKTRKLSRLYNVKPKKICLEQLAI